MQGENVCNFIIIHICKLFEGNERFSVAVYCNCMVEKNFHFTEALLQVKGDNFLVAINDEKY